MKKKAIIFGVICIVVITSVLLFLYSKKSEIVKKIMPSAYTSAVADSCNCEASWFPHDQTPPPAEGDGSPFDQKNTTNCMFHQWSWQKFLWLTKPMPSGNPLFLDSLHLVSPEMESVAPQLGLKLTLSAINQAGSEGVLLSNPKFNNVTDTVYYSIHIDNLFKDKAVSMAALINSGKIPYSNLETFPVGALELKVSWISLDAIAKDKQQDYFTTQAAVKNSKGKYVKKTVALLGMHVVGVVKNHPEFIWATFEHKDMAPVYDLKNNSVAAPNETLLFEKGKTSGIQGIKWDSISPVTRSKAFVLYEYGVPKILGTNAYMVTSQKEPANFDNITNINNCVASKLKDVFKNYFYNGSIWLNFDGMSSQQQAKAIVTRKISSALPDSLARGSVNLANITMETYTQTFRDSIHDIKNSNLVNCFTCHQSKNIDKTAGGRSPLYLSHVFGSYLFVSKSVPVLTANAKKVIDLKAKRIKESEALKIQQYKEFVKANQ